MKKSSILAVVAGNMIEWYDFALYLFLAPVLAHNFFAEENHLNAMLSTFLIFAIGFFIRPLGSILFGHLGDRIGRTKTLKISILLISLSTILMGLLPTYQHFGIYAGLMLAFLRLIQGLCIGGEFAGSMIYLSEMAAADNRGFMSSMANNGSNFGVLCATLIAALIASVMSEPEFYDYGWRISFVFGGILGLVGLWFRRNLVETPVFDALSSNKKILKLPILTVFKYHKKDMLNISLLLVMSATGSYVLLEFMSTYLNQYFDYPLSKALQVQSIYNVLTFLFIAIAAKFSDRYGRRPLLMLSAIGYIICTIPCFYFLETTGLWICLLPLVIFYCIEQATTPVTMVEIFSPKARYTGISFSYNTTMALIGGTAPMINTWLIAKFDNPMIIAYYLVIAALISLLVIYKRLPQKFGRELDLI
ncbi:MAG: MFS transporter [Legionellales bacterium]|jgi:MHS family proline/betaine transporter-like MFS transporter